jgi:hypothetical protein
LKRSGSGASSRQLLTSLAKPREPRSRRPTTTRL